MNIFFFKGEIMDSLTTVQLLRDAQQFYSDSFQCLLTVFSAFVAVVFAWRWLDHRSIDETIKNLAQKEAEKIKNEMMGKFEDFKVYTKIALVVTKFRGGKPTRRDLMVLTGQDYENMSDETVCALVYAIRYCMDYVDDMDVDMDLAKRVDNYVRPLAERLNSDKKNNLYGAIANQILMRISDVMEREARKEL